MDFQQMLQVKRFSVVVSLPENDLELARAALAGGAGAIRVQCNVWSRASACNFGGFAEQRAFFESLAKLCGSVPVGLTPGGPESWITPDEKQELEAMGFGFFTGNARYAPCWMMQPGKMARILGIGPWAQEDTLEALARMPCDGIEVGIQPPESYGTPLSYADILRYAHVVQTVQKPCLVPTQNAIRPEEVPWLAQAGCRGIEIGAVVLGGQADAAAVQTVTAAFSRAAEAL